MTDGAYICIKGNRGHLLIFFTKEQLNERTNKLLHKQRMKLQTYKLLFKELTVLYNSLSQGHCKGQTVDNLSFINKSLFIMKFFVSFS
jgi:hypothetical protein